MVVFRWPIATEVPDCTLYGPVVVDTASHLWLGATARTNNTGELTAVGEAMLWLLGEAPDDGTTAVELRYDSEYAAKVAQGCWKPEANRQLAEKVRSLVSQVQENRVITWTHVYGHAGHHDNELADRCARRGARGEVSPDSRRWAAPPPPPPHLNRKEKLDGTNAGSVGRSWRLESSNNISRSARTLGGPSHPTKMNAGSVGS